MPKATKDNIYTGYIIPVVCFFLSGSTALVYEICWIRKSSLIFGTTIFAASTVFAVFFAGLALGSYFAGKLSHKITRPLLVYAFLEIGLGILALCNPMLFTLSERLYGLVYPFLYHNFILLSCTRFIIISLLLLPPTVVMGTTLPLFCKHYTTTDKKISLSIGLLYGVNTLGAVTGCLLCGFYLIPHLGTTPSILLSGCCNLCIGILVWALLRKTKDRDAFSTDIKQTDTETHSQGIRSKDLKKWHYTIGVLFFGCGFATLGYEIIWMRFLSLIIHNTVYTYTVTLAVTLSGIVLGSIVTGFSADLFKRKALVFGCVQILYGLVVLIILLQSPDRWLKIFDVQDIKIILLISSIIIFLPAFLSGISFPLVIRMVIKEPEHTGTEVGIMSAVNTFGGIAGSLVTGFILLTLFGLHKSILILTGINLLIGSIALILLDKRLHPAIKFTLPVISLIAWLVIPKITGTQLPKDFLGYNKNLIDFKEGLSANLAVIQNNNMLHLEIDRLWQGTNKKNHQTMAAHVPMLLHPNPKRILNIGIGVGQTASRFLYYPIDRLDCIDIEQELFTIVRKHFPSDWMDDKRVNFIIEDGRNYITYTDNTYDLISIEIGQTFRPHLASFYTAEFYHHVKNHLHEDGIVCQFVSLACLGFNEFRSAIRTFIEVFPQSILWFNNDEFLLIGSVSNPVTLAQSRIDRIVSDSILYNDLSVSYWGGQKYRLHNPEVFMAGFLCGADSLNQLTTQAPLYHDNRPVLEYQAAGNQSNPPYIDRIKPFLESPQNITDFVMPDSMVAKINEIRTYNIGNVIAAALFKHYETKQQDIRILLEAYRYNPMHVSINFFLGLAFSRMNKSDKAFHHFNTVLSLQPNHARTHGQLAYLYMKMGIINQSAKHYTKLIEINPFDVHAYNNLGVLYLKQYRFEEALKQFSKALSLKPDYTGARKNLDYCKKKLAERGD